MTDSPVDYKKEETERKTNMRNLSLSLDSQFNYLPDKDRYYLSRKEPRFKINIIGTGINGQEHIRVAMLEGRATVHGIYDPNQKSIDSAIQEFSKYSPGDPLEIYESLEAACRDSDVDALIICTPNFTHLEIVKEAVKSKKHILVEKPLATNTIDAYEIYQIERTYPSVFQIGLQYRHKAIYSEAIHEVLERQVLGEVKKLSILEHRIPFLDKVNQWNKFSQFSGNTLIEKCCHYFDLLNLFAGGRPVKVYATGGSAVNFTEFEYKGKRSDILDHASVNITYENGITGNFDLCMFAPMIYEELIICGTDGRLKAWEKTDFLPHSPKGSYLEIITGDNKPSRIMSPMYPTVIDQTGHNGATYFAHSAFIDRIEKKNVAAATAKEALWSIIVAEAAQESIVSGSVVSIDQFLEERQIFKIDG